MEAGADHGLRRWVVLNIVLFVMFAASFFHPHSRWLTVYLLSSWLGSTVPALQATGDERTEYRGLRHAT